MSQARFASGFPYCRGTSARLLSFGAAVFVANNRRRCGDAPRRENEAACRRRTCS